MGLDVACQIDRCDTHFTSTAAKPRYGLYKAILAGVIPFGGVLAHGSVLWGCHAQLRGLAAGVMLMHIIKRDKTIGIGFVSSHALRV